MDETHVVTAFLRNRGAVLLLRRSDDVGSYTGRWGGVSGHVECDDPLDDARREIREETGVTDATLVRAGDPFVVADDDLGRRWVVHPFLFACPSRAVETDWETVDAEWVSPTDIRRRETVPDLWRSYARVAPTVETVAGDQEHGSAYLSIRALEVLRDRAGVLASEGATPEAAWTELASLARDLLAARPSMAVVTNRVNRAMAEAAADRSATAVERAAIEGIERAFAADETAAARAAEVVAGKTVCTLSRSGTVLDALRAADPEPTVLVAESRPAREGVGVAESLADAGLEVTLCTDAAVATLVPQLDVDVVLVGADAVLPDGSVVNKVGTRAAALAAARDGAMTAVVASSDKISLADEPDLEAGSPVEIYDGEANVSIRNPIFEQVESGLIDVIVTEDGPQTNEDVASVAADLRRLANWD